MAEDIDAAQPADASVLDRLPMRDEEGEIRHEFVERSRGRSMPPTGRCCVTSWRNCTRPTSAT